MRTPTTWIFALFLITVPFAGNLDVVAQDTVTTIDIKPPGQATPDYADMARDELIVERTIFTKTFENADGTRTMQLGADPLHFRPEGQLQALEPIDTDLEQDDGWRNERNSFPIHLPQVLGDGQAIAFGPGYGARWRPGLLSLILVTDEVRALAEPSAAEGTPSESNPSTVVYPQVYPGVDLVARVGAGSLTIAAVIRGGLNLDAAPEEIEALRLDSQLEVEEPLLEAIARREAEGETAAALPFYLGGPEDELVIGLAAPSRFGPELLDALVDVPESEENVPAYYRDADGNLMDAVPSEAELAEPSWAARGTDALPLDLLDAAGLRSPYFLWRQAGTISAYLHPLWDDVESIDMYQNAFEAKVSFHRDYRDYSFFKIGTDAFTLSWIPLGKGPEAFHIQGVWPGSSTDGRRQAAVVPFHGIDRLKGKIDPAHGKYVKAVYLGYRSASLEPAMDYPIEQPEYIEAIDLEQHHKDYELALKPAHSAVQRLWKAVSTNRGYSDSVMGPMMWSGPGTFNTFVDGKSFTFGPLAAAPLLLKPQTHQPYYGKPRAHTDLESAVKRGDRYFLVGLHKPYTAPTRLPPGQRPPGGMNITDMRLEVVIEERIRKDAVFSVKSPGGGVLDPVDTDLYPGETLSFDIELTSGSGFSQIEASIDTWPLLANGVKWSLPKSPVFRAPGDRQRLELTWDRVIPMPRNGFDLKIFGEFDQQPRERVLIRELRIRLRPATAKVRITAHRQTVDANQGMLKFGTVSVAPGSLRGAQAVELALWTHPPPGPTLPQSHRFTSTIINEQTASDLFVSPVTIAQALGAGPHNMTLEVCLLAGNLNWPWPCLNPIPLHLELTGTVQLWGIGIDFLEPWSLDLPPQNKAALPALKVHGAGLLKPNKVPYFSVSQQRGGAPLSLTTNVDSYGLTEIAGRFLLPGYVRCGPYEVTVNRGGGSADIDSSTLSITRPFRNNPSHLAIEAERGLFYGSHRRISSAEASNRQAVRLHPAPGHYQVAFTAPGQGKHKIYLRGKVLATPPKLTTTLYVGTSATGSPIASFDWIPRGTVNRYQMHPVRRSTSTTLLGGYDLVAGQRYLLTIQTNRHFDLDMIVVSTGALPLANELCL